MIQPTDYEFATERKEGSVMEAAAIVETQYKLDCCKRAYEELCGVVYREWDRRRKDAEIVRRFLAKAYGGSHPAMEALDRIEPRTAPPVKPATLHGDFGAMEFTAPKGSNPSTTTTTA